MKTRITTLTFALALTGLVPAQAQQVPQPKSADDVAGTPPGTVMTKEYVEMVGRLAYIWGWPLVNQINRRAAFSQVPEPGRLGDVLPVAPPGQIAMLTDYIKPEQTFVTCPNQDTVYGAGFQKLDTMPVVVQVPDFGDRFFTYQIVDHRTDSFASIGKQYGTPPGFYLLIGPNWKGDVPAGINAVFRSSTDLCAIFPRVFQDDTPEDKVAIYTDFDSTGQRLNGSNRYTVTFRQRPIAAGQWFLVADALQQGTSVRTERVQSLLARHQEQIAEVQSRRLADDLLSTSIAGSGQGNQLGAGARR
jgi:hypothetical protein